MVKTDRKLRPNSELGVSKTTINDFLLEDVTDSRSNLLKN